MADAADYDAGEITERERKAAENQGLVSGDNVLAVQNQLMRQMGNYAFSDAQNRALADRQLRQNSAKTSADRFEAQRDLQAAATGLLGSMGQAMNGSSLGNLRSMLRQRNDKENNTYWAQHKVNQDAIENAYQDSFNQNMVARRDAMQSAEKAIRDIESDWAANLNNINPNLFRQGAVNGIGHLSSTTAYDDYPGGVPGIPNDKWAMQSGYVQPSDGYFSSQATPSNNGRTRTGGDYFSQMMNRFSGR